MPAGSPQELEMMLAAALSKGDVDSFMALYEPGSVERFSRGEIGTGVDAIRQEVAIHASAKPDFKIEVREVIEAGDIALVHTQWSMTRPAPVSGRNVNVAHRQPDGSWRMLIACTLDAD